MIHIDQGGSIEKTKYFFDHFNRYKIPYDVIGFSYYPWWHGSLLDLRDNLAFTANRYHKDIIVVETAKPEVEIGYRDYLRAGVPITLMTLLVGWGWLEFASRY